MEGGKSVILGRYAFLISVLAEKQIFWLKNDFFLIEMAFFHPKVPFLSKFSDFNEDFWWTNIGRHKVGAY